MNTLKTALWRYLLLLSVLWWLADQSNLLAVPDFLAWRNLLSQYSGVLGIGVMSAAMLLSLRPAWLEQRLHGLDKMYRLHKWLGISGLILAVSHWAIAQSPKWLLALGLLERRPRPPRQLFHGTSLQEIIASQHGLAKHVGEWAFYAMVVLLLLALIKAFPYRRFAQTHRLMPLVYLALVFHSVLLLKFDYWSSPLGAALALLLASGCVAAVRSLQQRPAGTQASGTVMAVTPQPALGVLAVDVMLNPGWPGHAPGQFAFVRFHDDEGAHPFTLASAWHGDGRVRLLIKALGDYTATLPGRLQPGAAISLRGPHGRFTFNGSAARQIWISGGIGITPFLAQMQHLAGHGGGQPIDLFHCTADYDQAVMTQLAADAERAGINLHLLWDERDGRLDIARIVAAVPQWCDADVWFCGPVRFGHILRDELYAMGLPSDRFHQELFEMR